MTTEPDHDAHIELKQVRHQERRDTCEREGCTTKALDFPAEWYHDGRYLCEPCWEEARLDKEYLAKQKESKKTNHFTGRICGKCGLPYDPIEDEPSCAQCAGKSNE